MATENLTTPPLSLVAAADLRTHQHKFMVVSGDNGCNIAAGAGVACVGVLGNKPNTGEAAEIKIGPRVKVIASAAIAANAAVSTNAAGLAKTAATGERVLGIALEAAGAVNEIIAITWEPGPIAP
jgi:hypothetical protein